MPFYMNPNYSFHKMSIYNPEKILKQNKWLKKDIQNAELLVCKDPKSAGTPYKGKQFRNFRHLHIGTSKFRLVYVICAESRNLNKNSWNQAKKRNNFKYHACDFYCADSCIKIPENAVMFLKIINLSEQDRIFGGDH